jgi:glycosyltransferase involved in cell wall biosynthesis
MHIGFVSTRLAGTDGVSLETRKIARILTDLGHTCFFCAGELDPDFSGTVDPRFHFTHPAVESIQERAFADTRPDPELRDEIEAMAAELGETLARFCDRYAIDVLVPQNALAIPMHLPLGLALTNFIDKQAMAAVAHHHDFYWERSRFDRCCVPDLLERCFPPVLPTLRHMVINSLAQASLLRQLAVESAIVPNIFDYETAAPGITPENEALRSALGLDDEHLLILQPTRVIPRKGIELAVELVAQLQQPRWREVLQGKQPVLMISHKAGDEGLAYLEMLQRQAQAADVRLIYAGERFTSDEDRTPGTYSLWDAYVHADFVTYPSLIEGFGNALLETLYFRLPALVNRYEVYVSDLDPLGFDLVEIDGAVTDATVAACAEAMMDPVRRRRMTERNYEIARANFAYAAVTPTLAALFGA